MKFAIAASVATLAVSSMTAETVTAAPDFLGDISTQLSELMSGVGTNFCNATSQPVTPMQDAMPTCVGKYSAGISAAYQTISVCFPSDEDGMTRRLAEEVDPMEAFGAVLGKGFGLALDGTEFDTQILKLLQNDVMPALFDEVLNGCVLNATNPIVGIIGGLLFKGSAFTKQEYDALKQTIMGLVGGLTGGEGGERRLQDETLGDLTEGLLGECMSGGMYGGPRLAYGPPAAFLSFLNKTMDESNLPTSCEICSLLETLPMSTTNALDATLIAFLTNNRAGITKLIRDMSGMLTAFMKLVVDEGSAEGSMKSSVCNADKSVNLEVMGLGLGTDCITAAVGFEAVIWPIVADMLVAGLPDECDLVSDFLCGSAEPVFPLYSVETLGATQHATFADMVTDLPSETTTFKTYFDGINTMCANAKDDGGAGSSATFSMMAVFSTLAVAVFMK